VEQGELRLSYDLARAHVIARKIPPKILSNTNWLFEPLKRPSKATTRCGAAVNLAAFDSALGVFVAALCGMRNLNSLPR
jgi:hypothetical protein